MFGIIDTVQDFDLKLNISKLIQGFFFLNAFMGI